jgi:hypothetical protein
VEGLFLGTSAVGGSKKFEKKISVLAHMGDAPSSTGLEVGFVASVTGPGKPLRESERRR